MNEQNKSAELLYRWVKIIDRMPIAEGYYFIKDKNKNPIENIPKGNMYWFGESTSATRWLNLVEEWLEEIPAHNPSHIKEKDTICSHCGGFLIDSDGKWQHKLEEEEGEQPEVPEEIMQFIFKNSRGYGGDCYIIAACVKLYHKMQDEMPDTENPQASYWFEKAGQVFVERNEFKAKVSHLQAEMRTLREAEKYNASLIDRLSEQLKRKHDEAQEYRNLLKNIYDQGDLSGLCRSAQKDLNIVLEKYPIS